MRTNSILSPSLVSSLSHLAHLAHLAHISRFACLVAPLASVACGSAAAPSSAAEDTAQAQEAMSIIRCLQPTGTPLITSAYSVVAGPSGWVAGTPEVGDAQTIAIEWTSPSAPPSPFIVRVAIPGANVDTWVGPGTAYPVAAGAAMTMYVPLDIPGDSTRPIPLDGPIPVTVSLDPTRVSGLPGPSCTYNASYTPTMPATAMDLYLPQLRLAGIAVDATITPPASGATGTLFMGYPLGTNHQQVWATPINTWSVDGAAIGGRRHQIAAGTFTPTTTGALPYFYAQNVSPYLAGATSLHAEIQVEVTLSRVRVSKAILDQVTWAQLNADVASDAELPLYLQADAVNNPSDPSIVAFVNQTVGTSYKTSYPPYEVARKLFVATANALTYQGGTAAKPTPSTAVAALAAGWGDCGDYGMLLVTALRAAGIPARIVYGQWPTGGGTHVITEFWMTGAGWVPADATSASVLFPKSGYPYFFGNVPALDIWVGFGFGNRYEGDGLKETWVEGPGIDKTNIGINTWKVTQTNDLAP